MTFNDSLIILNVSNDFNDSYFSGPVNGLVNGPACMGVYFSGNYSRGGGGGIFRI